MGWGAFLRISDMNYEMTPGKLKTQDPSLLVKRLCIEQKNSPCFVLPDNKWSKPFLYTFSCECDGLWVEFDFEHPDRIEYGQYTWPEAVEKWLIPHLAKRPNADVTGLPERSVGKSELT
jgi:hypothetical protein